MKTIIRRCDEVFSTSFDDTVIMMSVTKGRYYGLNPVGSRIWEMLERETTESVLIEKLLTEYDVVPEVCAEGVGRFLTGLRERGLLTDVV